MCCIELFFLILIPSGISEDVYVDQDGYSSPCGSWLFPCSTLEAAISNRTTDLLTLQILSSTLYLDEPAVLENISAFELRGINESTSIICSTTPKSQPGLVFVSLENVTILNINFTGCGVMKTYNFRNGNVFIYRAAIHLYRCKDVKIYNLSVYNNHGGIAIIDSQGGKITISHSEFSNNHVPEQDISNYYGGGGIFVREGRLNTEDYPFVLQLSHCTFQHNQATFTFSFNIFNFFNQPSSGTGRGGGLDVILWSNASWNSIQISDCLFRNNTAYFGGGIAIQMYDDSHHNQISIERCTFEQNGCAESAWAGSGGGLHFGYSFIANSLEPFDNTFQIKDSIFTKNCADLGGGMDFFSSRSSDIYSAQSNTFLTDNCSFTENKAYVGAAIDISPHAYHRKNEGFLPTLLFKDCTFIKNSVAFHKLQLYQSFGSGALYSSLFSVDFIGFVLFKENSGSALVVINARANFSESNAVFLRNRGVQGGALSLIGVSAMVVGTGKLYNFTGNHATDRGGAVYNYLIDEHDFIASRSCFIHYPDTYANTSEWNTSFYFINNTAGTYGSSIFSSTILSCVHLDPSLPTNNDSSWNTSMILNWPDVFVFDDRIENQIASEAGTFNTSESIPFPIIPGDEHQLHIVATDDKEQEIETIFRASMDLDSGIDVDDAYSCVSGNSIKLKGETEKSGILLLQTISTRKRSIAVNVTLLPCPPGFELNGNECKCSVDSYSSTVTCDMAAFQARIKLGYWAGYIKQTYTAGICPLSFCNYNNTNYKREVPLPKITSSSQLDEYICGPTRTGILCGSCKPGYSVFYHSPNYKCYKSLLCDWGWLLYTMSELIPVTLVFVTILIFNIRITSGYISGFILFSQLLDPVIINGSGVIQNPVFLVFNWIYQLAYGVFTMEFFNIEPLSYCLWEGATVLDMLAFRYVTIAYAFILVWVIPAFLKFFGDTYSIRLEHIISIKTSFVNGLSAYFVLFYTQIIKVSIYILTFASVRGKNDEVVSVRVFFSGDTEIFSTQYRYYALPAIIILLILGGFPPILLLSSFFINNRLTRFCGNRLKRLCSNRLKCLCSNRLKRLCSNRLKRLCSNRLKCSCSNRLKHLCSTNIALSVISSLQDQFQGCFKENLRIFAGIYFLYRWIALLMFVVLPTFTGFYIGLGNIYILIQMFQRIFQPYLNNAQNIVDGCLFADLALIYSLAGYNYLFGQGHVNAEETYIKVTASIQLFLIYLPMIVFLWFRFMKLLRQPWRRLTATIHGFTILYRPFEYGTEL